MAVIDLPIVSNVAEYDSGLLRDNPWKIPVRIGRILATATVGAANDEISIFLIDNTGSQHKIYSATASAAGLLTLNVTDRFYIEKGEKIQVQFPAGSTGQVANLLFL